MKKFGVETVVAINHFIMDTDNEIKVLNDITVGKYDVVVVTGSTMPTNRMAQLEMYMDAYEKGIIDKQEVLKKTEVFDMEGVLTRTDIVAVSYTHLTLPTNREV